MKSMQHNEDYSEVVYVIGAGPGAYLGAAAAAECGADVIAGNYGVVAALNAGVEGGTWLVADWGLWEFDWPHLELIRAHKMGWNLGVSEGTRASFPYLGEWTFRQEPAAGLGVGVIYPPQLGEKLILSCGGTVASQMVQLAVHRNYSKIILCGCQLSGGEYWDGRLAYPDREDWPQKPTFLAFCDSARRKGVDVLYFGEEANNALGQQQS